MWEWLRVPGWWVVPPCTLDQWVNSPPPLHWGCVPKSNGVKPFYTLGQWTYSILLLTHRGNTRHCDILFHCQIVPTSMQYECIWARVDVWWVCTTSQTKIDITETTLSERTTRIVDTCTHTKHEKYISRGSSIMSIFRSLNTYLETLTQTFRLWKRFQRLNALSDLEWVSEWVSWVLQHIDTNWSYRAD